MKVTPVRTEVTLPVGETYKIRVSREHLVNSKPGAILVVDQKRLVMRSDYVEVKKGDEVVAVVARSGASAYILSSPESKLTLRPESPDEE